MAYSEKFVYQRDAVFAEGTMSSIIQNFVLNATDQDNPTAHINTCEALDDQLELLKKHKADLMETLKKQQDELEGYLAPEEEEERRTKVARNNAEEDGTFLAAIARDSETRQNVMYEKLRQKFNLPSQEKFYRPQPKGAEARALEQLCGGSQNGEWDVRKIVHKLMETSKLLVSTTGQLDQMRLTKSQADFYKKQADEKAETAQRYLANSNEKLVAALEEIRRLKEEAGEKNILEQENKALRDQLATEAALRVEGQETAERLSNQVVCLSKEVNELSIENARLAVEQDDSGIVMTPPKTAVTRVLGGEEIPGISVATFSNSRYTLIREGEEEILVDRQSEQEVKDFAFRFEKNGSILSVHFFVDNILQNIFTLSEEKELQKFMRVYYNEQILAVHRKAKRN